MFREINKILPSYVMLSVLHLVALTCVSEIPLLSFCSYASVTHNVLQYIFPLCIPYHARLKCTIFLVPLYFILHHLFYQEFSNGHRRGPAHGSFKCDSVMIYDGLFAGPRATNIIQRSINN